MDKVKKDLQNKQAEELRSHGTSLASIMANAVGPDGGMTAIADAQQNLHQIGQWNSKTTDEYVAMVKDELRKQGIKVDSVIEKRMIDYIIDQKVPKSTADYIMGKAAEGSLFNISQRGRQTSLDDYVSKEAENRYNPSFAEIVSGNVAAWAGNAAATYGLGGFWGQLAIDASVEGANYIAPGQQDKWIDQQKAIAKKELEEAKKKPVTTYPQWMLSQMQINSLGTATDRQLAIALNWAVSNRRNYAQKIENALESGSRTTTYNGKDVSLQDAYIREQQYALFVKAVKAEQEARKLAVTQTQTQNQAQTPTPAKTANVALAENQTQNHSETQSQAQNQPQDTQQQSVPKESTGDYSGWNNLLDALGMGGIGDTFNHLGLTLATLPDMLLGVFTGKTKSIGLNAGTMMPLAALLCGTFVKNPLLKIPLLLYGGLNILNKSGQEAMAEYRPKQEGVRYRQYADEALDKRIKNPQIEGNVLLLDIDNAPRIVNLPQHVIDAYQRGAVPLNTLANRILAKYDEQAVINREQTEQANEHYEQSKQREQSRGIR